MNVTFPELLRLQDLALLLLRVVSAIVFGGSGYITLKDPTSRAKSLELNRTFTAVIGAGELLLSAALVTGILIQIGAAVLILIGLGAIQKKVFKWKSGFWGQSGYGWHYDLMLLAMNTVVLCTAGGKLVIRL